MLAKCDDNGEKTLDMSTVKGEEKNLCKKDKYARIEQMRVTLGLSDYQRTPMVIFYFMLLHVGYFFSFCNTSYL